MSSSITRRHLLVEGSKVAVSASVLGSLLAACGGSDAGASGSVSLRYWVLGYSPKGANKTGMLTDAAVAAYKKAHANIKDISITGYTGDQAGFTKLVQAVQGGSTVDVFRLPSDVLPELVSSGSVAPIDSYLTDDDKNDIIPSILETVKINESYYAWPLWVPPVGMFLNLDIFKERGVEVPKDDWTYEEFVDIAKRLTFKRSDGQQVYGYTGVVDAGVVNTWPIIMGDGGTPLSSDNKKYTFNTPEGISGLQKLVDLALKHKVTPPDFGTQTPADMITGFSEKKNYAMYSEPSGSSATYKALKMNFTVKSMPIGAGGKPLTTGGIGLISVASIPDEGKLKAAMDMARYLTSASVGKDVSGYFLAPGARKSVEVNDPISLFKPFVPYTYITPIIPQWPQIRTLLHEQIQKAVLGKISPSQALNNPASEINSLLNG
ncbi:ABC transporter substrate-binding protein [Ktedonospora formicarum]|uniref:ABC transporter substrate-binding protein n=1 Tax=Ktedonospora formicarum TaxID=2778364 RepID=A0A8J3MQL1_9CHLR|nr:sugar ABC transporter substrate-binding protein [Ktedonospora formicarum]GHO42718.1 ABC transporter substrate-binding protein [Ktedonospora formicarum]